MAGGRGVEYGHPFKLLTTDEKDTQITNTEGNFATMVKASGEEAQS